MAGHFDLTDLQLIVHIGDWHSLTRGAEKTHLSLPAASTRIKNLEEHFGTQLLYRTSQGVTLTPSGAALTRHARPVMSQCEQLRGDMRSEERRDGKAGVSTWSTRWPPDPQKKTKSHNKKQ